MTTVFLLEALLYSGVSHIFDWCRHGRLISTNTYGEETMLTVDIGVPLILRKNPSGWIVTDLGRQFRQLGSLSGFVFCSAPPDGNDSDTLSFRISLVRFSYPN
ncbi:hypothetical protein AVEN_258495-1 [Araneus ventricosus]|uniref:Uncharacterized protein n=1 Tax=Araneus ventricosus TaxID=182803 RepID=A0A4Y2H8S8_ARAVE|nr:hypothetical protein AVEN_258495-1 [Araneus ventricosus]